MAIYLIKNRLIFIELRYKCIVSFVVLPSCVIVDCVVFRRKLIPLNGRAARFYTQTLFFRLKKKRETKTIELV